MTSRLTVVGALCVAVLFSVPAIAQRPVGANAGDSGILNRINNTIANRSVGRGYSIADVNAQALNRVRPVQVQNLAGTNFADSPLRGIAANAGAMPSSTVSSSPVAPRQVQRPFSNIQRQPTVSPYLLLFNNNNDSNNTNDFNYQTLVRPLLEQREFNQQVNRQQQQMNMQITALAGRADYQITGSEQITPTGHPTVFNNTLRYYPGLSRGR